MPDEPFAAQGYSALRNLAVQQEIIAREIKLAKKKQDLETIDILRFHGISLVSIDLSGAFLGASRIVEHVDRSGWNDIRRKRTVTCYTDFRKSDLRFANLNTARAAHCNFEGADLSFAGFIETNLEKSDFRGARLAGADFESANVAGTKFTLTPGLLTANFKNAKGLETAEFYMEHGKDKDIKIVGISTDENGFLFPAVAHPEFFKKNGAGKSVIKDHFTDYYPGLKREADAMQENFISRISAARKDGTLPACPFPPEHFFDALTAKPSA